MADLLPVIPNQKSEESSNLIVRMLWFLPRYATQSAVRLCCRMLSVCPSVTLTYIFHTVWILEYFENNFMAE